MAGLWLFYRVNGVHHLAIDLGIIVGGNIEVDALLITGAKIVEDEGYGLAVLLDGGGLLKEADTLDGVAEDDLVVSDIHAALLGLNAWEGAEGFLAWVGERALVVRPAGDE